jgi:y4mF family transcriptional regulator
MPCKESNICMIVLKARVSASIACFRIRKTTDHAESWFIAALLTGIFPCMQEHAESATWGAAVRARRKTQRLRQDELAALAEVSTRSVHAIESSKATVRLDVLLAVCSALGLGLHILGAKVDITIVSTDRPT